MKKNKLCLLYMKSKNWDGKKYSMFDIPDFLDYSFFGGKTPLDIALSHRPNLTENRLNEDLNDANQAIDYTTQAYEMRIKHMNENQLDKLMKSNSEAYLDGLRSGYLEGDIMLWKKNNDKPSFYSQIKELHNDKKISKYILTDIKNEITYHENNIDKIINEKRNNPSIDNFSELKKEKEMLSAVKNLLNDEGKIKPSMYPNIFKDKLKNKNIIATLTDEFVIFDRKRSKVNSHVGNINDLRNYSVRIPKDQINLYTTKDFVGNPKYLPKFKAVQTPNIFISNIQSIK